MEGSSRSTQQQQHHFRQRSVSLNSNHDDAAASALASVSPPSPVSRSNSPTSNGRLSSVSRRPTTFQTLPRESYVTRKPVGSGHPLTPRQAFGNANTQAQRRPRFLRNWWMEIGACLLFMIAFVAIIATLYPHQGKPLPEWPFQISINALVSVYVVVLKTTIIFVTAEGLGQLKWQWFREGQPLHDLAQYDSASRGPLGSTTLLWRLGLRHPLASCGALITVVMLVIDPFAQQIIRYRNCDVPIDGGVATVARTNYYQGHGGHEGPFEQSTEPALQAAINAGVFSPGTLASRSCITGNCSFPEAYSSLGFCSGCSDATADISTHYYHGKDKSGDDSSVNVSLPSGGYLPQSLGQYKNVATWDAYPLPNSTINVVEFIVANDAFDIDKAEGKSIIGYNSPPPPGCAPDNSTWYCKGYGAARCAMGPCVKSYRANITVGDFSETLVEESPVDPWGFATESAGFPVYATVDTHCINDDEKSELENANYIIDPKKRWLPYNITVYPSDVSNDTFPYSLLLHNCLYAIDGPFVGSVWEFYLGTIFFNGTAQGVWGESGISHYNGPQNLLQVYDYGNVSLESLNSTFQNISESMTTYLRDWGNANHSEPARGNVLREQTCLQVRWGWLSLPAALVVVTLLFFIVMIIQTRPTGNRAQIWKSSCLALIYHGLEPHNAHQDGLFLEDIKEMEDEAKTMRVRLGITTNGVKFVETAGSPEKYTPQERG